MTINQLFKKQPNEDLILEIFSLLGYKELTDDISFTKNEITNNDVFSKICEKLEILKEFYLPCKKKVYFEDLNHKKIITILRQTLKLFGYKIESREKLSQGQKLLIYRIKQNITDTNNPIKNSKCTIVFD
jgi:hypothetical protein